MLKIKHEKTYPNDFDYVEIRSSGRFYVFGYGHSTNKMRWAELSIYCNGRPSPEYEDLEIKHAEYNIRKIFLEIVESGKTDAGYFDEDNNYKTENFTIYAIAEKPIILKEE